MVTNELKAYVEKHRGIREVWFASDGSYLFQSKPTHLMRKTRDEVLNGRSSDEAKVIAVSEVGESVESEEATPKKKR